MVEATRFPSMVLHSKSHSQLTPVELSPVAAPMTRLLTSAHCVLSIAGFVVVFHRFWLLSSGLGPQT